MLVCNLKTLGFENLNTALVENVVKFSPKAIQIYLKIICLDLLLFLITKNQSFWQYNNYNIPLKATHSAIKSSLIRGVASFEGDSQLITISVDLKSDMIIS